RTYYLKRLAIDIERLADRVFALEKALGYISAYHHHIGTVVIVRINNVAPHLRLFCVHLRHIGGDAVQRNVFQCVALILQLGQPAINGRGNRLGQPHIVVKKQVVVPDNDLVSLLQPQKFIKAGDQRKPADLKNVGAKVGYFLRNVTVRAIDHRDDDDQRRNRKNYAQQRKERPQLMRSQRLQRN